MKKITTILFDFDGTLYHHDYDNDGHYWEFLSSLGYPTTPDQQLKVEQWTHYYFANSPEIQEDKANVQALNTSMFHLFNRRKLAQIAACDEPTLDQLVEQVTQFLDQNITGESYLGEDVIQTLTALRPHYKLGLITNRSNPVNEHLETLNIAEFFDTAYAAGEVNVWKPNPEIFERAFQELNIQPEEAIYVGDNHFADVAAAIEANMLPILIDPKGTFEDPGCNVIHKISDLIPILENLNSAIA